ncbi:MAG: EAL domain-containing protein [Oscillospiraceae bacterium]|nr:EAL domain-containing protein [Oscillospiraceae bacterium]
MKRIISNIRKSFIKKIIALIFIFNIVIIALFTFMTYIITKSNVSGNVTSVIDSSVTSAARAVNDYLDTAVVPLKMIESVARDGSNNELMNEMQMLTDSYSGGIKFWYLSAEGSAVTADGETDGIITADYSWYADAENSESHLPRVYTAAEGGTFFDSEAAVTVVMPINKNGEFIGCAGAEFSEEGMTSRLQSSVYGEGIYAVISDKTGAVLCISCDESQMDKLMDGRSLTDFIRETGSGAVKDFKNGHTTNYVSCRTIPAGWKLTVIYDGNVADGSFSRMYSQQVIILACLFVLELIATLNVIKHEAKDIPEISRSIEEISRKNFNTRIGSVSENEIGLIARSVDELAQKLQDQNKQIDEYRNIDPTTQLKNRYRLYEYLNDLAVSRDETRQRFALLFVDIDNFKWITETLGHKLGDEFLRTFGQRLKAAVPNVFRFSGDEFVVVTEFNDDYGVIEEVIKNLRAEMAEPIEILNDKLYAQFSVGVSVFPDDDTNLDMLLRDADIAVSRAKEKGKGRTAYFNPSFHQKLANKATIAQKLNKALENNEMFLKFQPIISVRNGDIHGFEVLVRWENDELGHVPPFTFVQIAEETGAIVEIGTWIFETGCRYLKRMNEYNSDIIMSINVSAVQLKKKDFIDKVVRTLEIFHIDPKNLQIEITETCLVDFAQGGNNVLQKLADLGISLALDDFGTGYSSFGYLKDMPIKTLKVDKSFVDEICNKNKDLQITGSIIDMVRNLGIKTVVEGVESIEQYNILSEMQCDYIQGFLMSKPLSANDAMEFVKSYDELHKPNRRSLEENSNRLAAEREEKEKQLEEKESK